MEKKRILPNFLIVGMAKCGTSSLSSYLQQHPDVFISKKKEPRFITSQCMRFPMGGPKDDLVESWYVKDFDEYLKLFQFADEKAIGEASADTLYFYKGSIPVIKQYLGDPKIIIILRNPVKRVLSAYQHLVRDEREFISLEEALKKEPERIEKNYELIYHYKQASLYYEPVKAFLENFSKVKVLLNEDLEKSPADTLHEVFEFLEVDSDVEIDTKLLHNVSGIPKNKFLQDSFQDDHFVRKAVRPIVRTIFPSYETRTSVFNWITRKNLKRIEMSQEVKNYLREYFKEDVSKTSTLLKRDLSFWLK